MLRWRNWGLKYVGVLDRALKLCPGRGTYTISKRSGWILVKFCVYIDNISRKKQFIFGENHDIKICK